MVSMSRHTTSASSISLACLILSWFFFMAVFSYFFFPAGTLSKQTVYHFRLVCLFLRHQNAQKLNPTVWVPWCTWPQQLQAPHLQLCLWDLRQFWYLCSLLLHQDMLKISCPCALLAVYCSLIWCSLPPCHSGKNIFHTLFLHGAVLTGAWGWAVSGLSWWLPCCRGDLCSPLLVPLTKIKESTL